MACIPGSNPSKTLGNISSSSSSHSIQNNLPYSSLARIHFKTAQISQRLPKISIVMATKQQEHELSLNALTSSDRRDEVMIAANNSLSNCLSETNLHLTIPALKFKTRGKVRDIYDGGDYLVLVTTDRQSAFDRVLASIPFKGQVLNDTSLWWFNQTQHIAPNAIIAVPDQNVTIAKKCSVFPVEFVVRGYVTGSTDTSLWTVYKNGVRNYCGNVLPEGMVKNERLPANIITPTTKAADHDVPITPDEIVQQGLMSQADYDEASSKALSLFEYGQVERALLVTGFGYEHDDPWATNMNLFKEFTDISRGVRRLGAAAVDMCHVALGIVEAYWEYRLKPWDMAAGVLIVEEAGGAVSCMDGGKFTVFDRSLLVSNGVLHSKLLERIGPATEELKGKGIDFSLWYKPDEYNTEL